MGSFMTARGVGRLIEASVVAGCQRKVSWFVAKNTVGEYAYSLEYEENCQWSSSVGIILESNSKT